MEKTETNNNQSKDHNYQFTGGVDLSDLQKKFEDYQNGAIDPREIYKHTPEIISAENAAKHMIGKKHIMILTGAGLSAASGIPTFRGVNGFWNRKNEEDREMDPQAIMTYKYFYRQPEKNWQWHHDFIELQKRCQPNKGHHSILKFQEFCQKNRDKNVESFLVTQNVDNYHNQLIKQSKVFYPYGYEEAKGGTADCAFTPNIYEIHGNALYMHCSNEDEECSKIFYKTPPLSELASQTSVVPKCQTCGKNMKPHCMFFDECYTELYYKSTTVENYMDDKMDCLIVVGTALATGFAKRIVNKALDKIECPVIEVNLETSIDIGYNLQVLEKSETALVKLFEEYYRLITPKPEVKSLNKSGIKETRSTQAAVKSTKPSTYSTQNKTNSNTQQKSAIQEAKPLPIIKNQPQKRDQSKQKPH
ncbi:silent information regulator protein sir2 [Stylonychia lemnae]|uniref:Silent information regulator protein sir2 n=1 Tax=Stylonychia lemnae TaxID=5949 RepID=A0A078ALX1_STYLE|nr:silent information regulator protein sir2 [Stylonychia lemnae]|eukprot:CDW83229.1 silent information regulator protein sir2 [Stylonychia lemnae]